MSAVASVYLADGLAVGVAVTKGVAEGAAVGSAVGKAVGKPDGWTTTVGAGRMIVVELGVSIVE